MDSEVNPHARGGALELRAVRKRLESFLRGGFVALKRECEGPSIRSHTNQPFDDEGVEHGLDTLDEDNDDDDETTGRGVKKGECRWSAQCCRRLNPCF